MYWKNSFYVMTAVLLVFAFITAVISSSFSVHAAKNSSELTEVEKKVSIPAESEPEVGEKASGGNETGEGENVSEEPGEKTEETLPEESEGKTEETVPEESEGETEETTPEESEGETETPPVVIQVDYNEEEVPACAAGIYNLPGRMARITLSGITEELLYRVQLEIFRNGEACDPFEGDFWKWEDGKAAGEYYFTEDGRYEWQLSGVDQAGVTWSYPESGQKEQFLIDTSAPSGTILLDGIPAWDPEFGNEVIYRKNMGNISLETFDQTSGIAVREYYWADHRLSTEEIAALPWETTLADISWEDGSEQVLYCRVTDYAGHSCIADTPLILIDREAPEISLTDCNGGTIREDGCYSEKAFTLRVKERCFSAAENEIRLSIQKGGKEIRLSGYEKWIPGEDGWWYLALNLPEDGQYQLAVNGKDPAGNETHFYRQFSIDTSSPSVGILGVTESAHYCGMVLPVVEVRDSMLLPESVSVRLLQNETELQLPENPFTWESIEDGIRCQLPDIPHTGIYDGHYELQIYGEDLAGNSCRESLHFWINRAGSSFTRETNTAEYFFQYYIKNPADFLVRTENISAIRNTEIVLCHGNALRRLSGEEYSCLENPRAGDRKVYQYRFPSDLFKEEGYYSIHIQTLDEAGNVSDSDAYNQNFCFIVDQTAPSVLVSRIAGNPEINPINIEEKQIFEIEARDNFQLVKLMIAFGNRNMIFNEQEWKKLGNRYQMAVLANETESIIHVTAWDAAGNCSELDYSVQASLFAESQQGDEEKNSVKGGGDTDTSEEVRFRNEDKIRNPYKNSFLFRMKDIIPKAEKSGSYGENYNVNSAKATETESEAVPESEDKRLFYFLIGFLGIGFAVPIGVNVYACYRRHHHT